LPANPRTLQATEAYRRRVIGTRKALQGRAERLWPTIQQLDDTAWSAQMAAAVAQSQTEAVRITSGYLGAVLTLETGKRTAPPPIDPSRYAGLTRDGRTLSEAFQSPLIGVLGKLKEGGDYLDALKFGLNRATRMVGLEYDWSHHQSMMDAIAEDDRFVGWTRAVAGTCGACAAAADGTVSQELHFEVHPSCQCVSEPEVARPPSQDGNTPGLTSDATLNQQFAGRICPDVSEKGTLTSTKFSASEIEALKGYAGTPNGAAINSYLRGQLSRDALRFPDLMDARIAGINSAMETSGPIGRAVAVGRHIMDLDPLRTLLGSNPRAWIGKTFTDRGLMSTSISESYGISDALSFRLTVDPRVRGVWGANRIENELILERGCRVVIEGVERVAKYGEEGKKWLVHARVLPPD
jgi:hypothetical protein